MTIRLQACGRTDVGIKRNNNEDAFAINLPGAEYPDGLFLVADGIGGLSRGEDASQLTIRTILKSYFAARSASQYQHGDHDEDELLLTLREAVESANATVLDESGINARQRMGSTVAGMLIDGRSQQENQAVIFNVGDTRVYQLRGGQATQLSEDQVFQFPFESKDEDGNPRRATRLTAFIGQNTPLDPHFQRISVQAGDMYVLCSDGLWSLVEPEELRGVLTALPFLETADRLIQLARDRGAPDNITVIVVRVVAAQTNLLRWLPVIAAGGAAAALLIAAFLLLQTPLSTPASVASAPTDPAIEILPTDAPSITILSTPTQTIMPTEPATALPASATVVTDDLEEPESAGAQVAVIQNAQTLTVATTQAALMMISTSTTTNTALPTATATITASATFMATNTLVPTNTSISVPTATPTLVPSATVTPTPAAVAVVAEGIPASVILPDGSELLTNTGLAYRLFRDNRRVRSGPALDYAVVAVIEAGDDPYPLLARYKDSTENWFLILLKDGQVGWVFHDTTYSEIIRSGGDLSQLPKILWATITPTP